MARIQPHLRGIEGARAACGRPLPPTLERLYQSSEISKAPGYTSQVYRMHQLRAWALVGWQVAWQALFDDANGSNQAVQIG